MQAVVSLGNNSYTQLVDMKKLFILGDTIPIMEKKLLFCCPIFMLLINSLYTVKIWFSFRFTIGFDQSLQDKGKSSLTLLFQSWKSATWFNISTFYLASFWFGIITKQMRQKCKIQCLRLKVLLAVQHLGFAAS